MIEFLTLAEVLLINEILSVAKGEITKKELIKFYETHSKRN